MFGSWAAVDNSASETCSDFRLMSNAETFYLTPQNIKGCSVTDEPGTSSRYVVGILIFENLISRYENYKSQDSSSTRNLTQHSGVDDALNTRMLQHTRHDSAQLWLDGGPWEVQRQGKMWRSQITKRDHLSHVLVSYQT